MAGINISTIDIDRYRKFILDSKQSVNSVLHQMMLKLKNAGDTWDDYNYQKLEKISIECVDELRRVYEIILNAEQYLDSIYTIVYEYESNSFSQTVDLLNRETFISSLRMNSVGSSKSKKMRMLKDGLSRIEAILKDYKKELLARGLVDNVTISAVLKHFCHQYQANLVSSINGGELFPWTTPNFDTIVSNIQRNGLDQYQVSSTLPRNLFHTKYEFQDITFNGKKMNVYDDPIGTGSLLIKEQGNSQYPMAGTCGLCQSANILTMAGIPTSEDDIISIALHSSDDVLACMELFNKDPDDRGGTTVQNRQEILETQGVPITNLPINFNRNYTVRQLANAVASGHGVILSVDVERLWRNGQSGGHAISLLSVTSDGSTFIYSDTGCGRIDTISATDLAAALTGRPANITTNIIR